MTATISSSADVDVRHAPAVGRGSRVRPALVPAALVVAAFAAYLTVSLRNERDLVSAAYDLGIFHQALLSWSHLHLPVSSIKNSTEGLPPHYDLLADHFHPILVLLVPTYWIWPHPVTLLVDQAALVASSLVPIYAFCRRRMGTPAAVLLCIAYAGSLGVQSAIDFDFHEVAFAPLLIALALERADARSWRWATASALLLLAVKEDMGLLLPFLGVVFAIWGARRVGAALVAGGVVAFLLITDVVMPALGDGASYAYWTYPALGPTPLSAALHVVLHPLRTLGTATAAGIKRTSIEQLFLPFSVLPLFSPIALLAIPLLAERFLSDRPEMWTDSYQYSLTLMPVLVLAVADSLGTLTGLLPSARARTTVPLAASLLAVAATASLSVATTSPFAEVDSHAVLYAPSRVTDLRAALAAVPPHATVAASDPLVVPLLGRDTVNLLHDDDPGTSWVVFETDAATFVPWQVQGTPQAASYAVTLQGLEGDGYRVVISNGYAVVLTR